MTNRRSDFVAEVAERLKPLSPVLSPLKVDFAASDVQPDRGRVVLATVLSIVGSLAADALIVLLGEAIFPSTKGYVHFQFVDYARLTIVGVVGACVGWPIVTRISSAPRWLFSRLAMLVTLVLLAPDLYIWMAGSPAKAVEVLVVMHLAIALVTYNALVRLAPVPKVTSTKSGSVVSSQLG